MNRFELLILLALIFTATIFVLKSKWFDRTLEWLLSPSKDKTPKDIKASQKQVEADKKNLKKRLDAEAKNLQAEIDETKKL